jgi:hypothetical protein
MLKGVYIPYFHHEFFSVFFGIIILNFASNDKIKISLENKYFNYLGNISYGLYMYHPIGIMLAISLTVAIGFTTNWLIYPLSLLFTIIIAGLSYRYFETYFLKFKHKFSKVLSGNGSNSNGNTFIGVGAGIQQLTGINNVALGFNAGAGSSFPNLNNTICIGGGISPTNDNDIILSNSSNSYIKFSNSGGWCFESFSPGNATLKLLGVGGVAGGLAGVLQIVAGTNGGASLQLQDNGTNPITTSGYGNFASVGGFPFYYSPTSGWSQLASVPTTTFTLTLTPSVSGGNTYWTTSPTLTTTLNSNSFNFTFYTNVSNSTTANAPSPLLASGNYIAGTGTAILQKYTNSSITYNGYLFSIVNSNGLPITTTTTITPTPVSNFNVVDSQYFFSSNVNLIFNCIKIN